MRMKIVAAVAAVTVVAVAIIASLYFNLSPDEFTVSTKGGCKIAIIDVSGEISSDANEASPAEIKRMLIHACEDDDVKAIVIRINSGGGTAGDCWEMFSYVRDASEKKPVVAYIRNIGASGAYLVASAADKIVATPVSIVGGIGASLEFPFDVPENASEESEKISSISSGRFKDMFSDYRLDEEERAYLKDRLKSALDVLLECIAEKRNVSEETLRNISHGGWFTGEESLKMGLIDRIGDIDDAVNEAAKLAGISVNDAKIVVLHVSNGEVYETEYQILHS